MAVAFGQLTNVLGQRQNENIPANKDDDCDLYAKLLAIKLRELSTDERKIMMYQIDGLFINRISQKSNERHNTIPSILFSTVVNGWCIFNTISSSHSESANIS
ncbi:unnamed protein product [Pieris macdunnoughi]|uniref:Uncharacterized protein n=1 Tax=Pieris macdunnoughi TaxID=345717 RepID=A0A821UK39_9NEOP|nr:unnamed protein product [Pieris macdunnoughi]